MMMMILFIAKYWTALVRLGLPARKWNLEV